MTAFTIIVLALIGIGCIASCIYIIKHKSLTSCCGDCSKCSKCRMK